MTTTERRPRPYIALSIRVKVAERQLIKRGIWNHENQLTMEGMGFTARGRLDIALKKLFGEEAHALDHTPPLAERAYNPNIKDEAARYTPNANDPDHLVYRTKVASAASDELDHRTKTYIRGEHGQFSDVALIKRQRRRDKRAAVNKKTQKKRRQWRASILSKPKQKIAARPFDKAHRPMRRK